jgi:spermidine synthase
MPRPWTILESVATAEGALELRQRGERDFMITIDGRVLMSSNIHGSEVAVAQLGCKNICERPRPHVLIGGLGLGFTLRAALDQLPPKARVTVAELNRIVVRWCRGPVAAITDGAVADSRVRVYEGDVTREIRRVAGDVDAPRFDAIVLDLYIGPGESSHGSTEALYGMDILGRTHAALSAGGTYAVWGEDPDPSFVQRLQRVGFETEVVRTRGGGPRHTIYLAHKPAHAPRSERPAQRSL